MLSLGIDCAQLHHRFCLLHADGRVLAEGRLEETISGLASLRRCIQAYGQPVITLLEASGPYWHNLSVELAAWGWQPTAVDPQQATQFARLLHPRHKTDKADANSLAHMGFSQPQASFRSHEPAVLAHGLAAALQQRTVLQNQLHSLLVVANPALIRCGWDLSAPRTLSVLAAYPTTLQLRRARGLATRRYAVRNRVGAKAAAALQQASRQALCGALTPAHATQITFLVSQISAWNDHIAQLEQTLAHLIPEAARLVAVRGIGMRTALLICALIPFHALASAKAAAAFVGLHPHVFQSGKSCWSRLSKRGNAIARAALYRVALPAVQHNPDCAAFYDRLISRSDSRPHALSKKQALCAVAHKLIRICFAIMTNRRPHPALQPAQ